MSEFNLSVVVRKDDEQGKGASRRLRKENLVPAIIYGGKSEPVSIAIKYNELVKALENEAFFSHILQLNVAGNTEEVIIKAMQRHPAKGFPMHVDFQRIVRGQAMNFTVPLHVVGNAKGTEEGGVLQTNMTEVEVSCLPRELPEFIEVHVDDLAVGDVIRLSELKLPKGLSIVELNSGGTDRVVVSIQPPTVDPAADTDDAVSLDDAPVDVAQSDEEANDAE